MKKTFNTFLLFSFIAILNLNAAEGSKYARPKTAFGARKGHARNLSTVIASETRLTEEGNITLHPDGTLVRQITATETRKIKPGDPGYTRLENLFAIAK